MSIPEREIDGVVDGELVPETAVVPYTGEAIVLADTTDAIKARLGNNPDMWSVPSRMR